MSKTLKVEYLLARLTDIGARYADDEVARIARVITDRIQENPERVAARCSLLPRAFGDPQYRPGFCDPDWEDLRCERRGLTRVTLRTCRFEELYAFYSFLFYVTFRSEDSGGLSCLVADIGDVQLKLVPLRDEPDFDGYPVHQLGFEVPNVDEAVSSALRSGGRLEGEVIRTDGRLHACVRDPDGNTIELFGMALS